MAIVLPVFECVDNGRDTRCAWITDHQKIESNDNVSGKAIESGVRMERKDISILDYLFLIFRARWFIIADTSSEDFLAVENTQNVNAPQGAGIQAAQTVASKNVQAVLTGHCGPKAFHVLTQAGIKVYVGVEGAVSGALEQLKAGTLKEALTSDVEGHW